MNIKENKGISLITLVITIVVIIILAAITMRYTSNLPDEAHFTKYMQVMKNVQMGVENKKIINSEKGLTEQKLTAGFEKIILEDAPIEFVSFDDISEPISGYLVNLETIGYEDAPYGKAYKNYGTSSRLAFGDTECDVYVFDADWQVYYVKGLKYNDSMNYTFE